MRCWLLIASVCVSHILALYLSLKDKCSDMFDLEGYLYESLELVVGSEKCGSIISHRCWADNCWLWRCERLLSPWKERRSLRITLHWFAVDLNHVSPEMFRSIYSHQVFKLPSGEWVNIQRISTSLQQTLPFVLRLIQDSLRNDTRFGKNITGLDLMGPGWNVDKEIWVRWEAKYNLFHRFSSLKRSSVQAYV